MGSTKNLVQNGGSPGLSNPQGAGGTALFRRHGGDWTRGGYLPLLSNDPPPVTSDLFPVTGDTMGIIAELEYLCGHYPPPGLSSEGV